ncbi:MAG: methyltransferase domain-containing protein [Magnetococcales bacterium]|nr:methyltransferase domain-containing protein [Magnetococcales bacterium]MBF0437824.1 methyltransferase domain-containing protein [Magnetococcales bacterium]
MDALFRKEGEFPDWETLYNTEPVQTLPWFTLEPDLDLVCTLKEHHISSGTFLDLGTGPGTQAVWLAKQGFQVTGSDLSLSAIAAAEHYARSQGVCVALVEDDILASSLEGPFDYIFDRGCFHVLPPEARAVYVQTAFRLLNPQGRLLLKCFHVKETGMQGGPHRFSTELIRSTFSSHFELLTSHETHFEGTRSPNPLALFNILQPRNAK